MLMESLRSSMQSWTLAQVDMRELLPQEVVIEEAQPSTSHQVAKRNRWAGLRCASIACITVMCFVALVSCVWWSRHTEKDMQVWPGLEGEVPNEEFFLQHLGGFCFGSRRIDDDAEVGAVELQLTGKGSNPWWSTGALYLLAFDDQPNHWGLAKSNWTVDLWARKVSHANACLPMFVNHSWTGSVLDRLSDTIRVRIVIRERFKRHWNFALLGLGLQHNNSSQASIHYEVLASNALSSWVPGWRDVSQTCPWEMKEFVKEEAIKATAGSETLRPGLPTPKSDMCHLIIDKYGMYSGIV
eukprot:gnl/MRDRNA2_/MRDRNA2_157888_c0_seq1.p1 gnl/MRDRNA2_/MRDRNA2_157888_c0~~gnl/MRDRNA2_/MRDRNA2_157888_c0_seq1.p1  ORF type:complete len:298 (-),score=34.48 gnl/MRDRNA2_/MRDRNA2_157888_c0_seq1:87-980(-)